MSEPLTIDQAAKHLHGLVSSQTIRRWCKCGLDGIALRHSYIGRKVIIQSGDLDRFVDATSRIKLDAGETKEIRKMRGNRRRVEEEYQAAIQKLRDHGIRA